MKPLLCKPFLAAGFLLSFTPGIGWTGAPACYGHSSGPYCTYNGAAARVYVNEAKTILLYFDVALDLSAPASVGIAGVGQTKAAAVFYDEDLDFAKFVYSTALAAQARGARISIQMRSVRAGYLKIDRIWVDE